MRKRKWMKLGGKKSGVGMRRVERGRINMIKVYFVKLSKN